MRLDGDDGAYADTPQPSNGNSSNGHASGSLSKVTYETRTAQRREWKQETMRLRDEIRAESNGIQKTRMEAMVRASEHAGSIGLIYQAEDNSFCRVIVTDPTPKLPERPTFPSFPAWRTSQTASMTEDGATEAETIDTDDQEANNEASNTPEPPIPTSPKLTAVEIPKRPALPDPPALPKLPDTDAPWKRSMGWKSAMGWIASLFVGLFVGYGLFAMIGGSQRREPVQFYIALVIGICVLVGIKLLMDVTWHRVGRARAEGDNNRAYLIFAVAASILMVSVEAGLGGYALHLYTKKSSFGGTGGLSLLLTVPLATAISTATLLLSGVVGFQKGERSLTMEDLIARRHAEEREAHSVLVKDLRADYDRDVAEWQSERERLIEEQEAERQWNRERLEDARESHKIQLAHHEEIVKRRLETHDGAINQREERLKHYESLRTLPDFQELCRYISLIGALNIRIAELESKDTSIAIGRGRGWQDAY